jgi:hypothetical protein
VMNIDEQSYSVLVSDEQDKTKRPRTVKILD